MLLLRLARDNALQEFNDSKVAHERSWFLGRRRAPEGAGHRLLRLLHPAVWSAEATTLVGRLQRPLLHRVPHLRLVACVRPTCEPPAEVQVGSLCHAAVKCRKLKDKAGVTTT